MENIPKPLQWAVEKYGLKKVDDVLSSIIDATLTDNAKTMKLQISTNSTIKRLATLVHEDMNVEYINTGGPLVEYSVRRLILTYEFVLNAFLVLVDFDKPLHIRVNVQNDNNALGSLINELRRFSKNEKLFGLLNNFNGHKKKAGHKAYEDEADISKVNEQLRGYVRPHPIGEIQEVLNAEHKALQDQFMNKLVVDFGCSLAGPMNKTLIEKRLEEIDKKKKK